MPNVIKPKRSYTALAVPTGLVAGEIAINAADGKVFLCNAAGTANILVSSLARTDHTGTLSVASGGTGLTTLTANNVVLGNGTSAPSFVAPSSSGNVLTSNGTTWASATPAAATGMPTGALMPYAGSSAPTGYLMCDGSAVSRTTYAALFAVTSTTYGVGNNSTTFNLPDMRGRMPLGAGTGAGLNASGTGAITGTAQTARTAGQWLGEETHLLITAELASHTHGNTVSGGNTSDSGTHYHTFSKPAISFNSPNGNFSVGTPAGTLHRFSDGDGVNDTDSAANHAHTFSPSITNVAAGSDARHATMPPALVTNYIIKT